VTISPNGGEAWGIGETHTVRWAHNNLAGLINVYYNPSYPSGEWQAIAIDQSDDTLGWVVPGPVTGSARVRVASVNLPTYMDESNGDFSLGSGVTLLSPNGGENWSLTGLATIAGLGPTPTAT